MSEIGPSASETGNATAPIPTESADSHLPTGFTARESGLIAPDRPTPKPLSETAAPTTDQASNTEPPTTTEKANEPVPVHADDADESPGATSEEPPEDATSDTILPGSAENETPAITTKESATNAADTLINRKITELRRKQATLPTGTELSSDEKNLLAIDALRNGYSPQYYKGKEGQRVTLKSSLNAVDKDGNGVTVIALAKDDIVDGKREYSCYVEGQAGPIQVTADALITSHKSQRTESIASNFPEGPQRDLVLWNIKGEIDDEPSPDVINAVEAELDAGPFKKADTAIAEQIVLLEAGLAAEDLPSEERRVKQAILTGLKIAEKTVGDIGNLYKMNVLKCAQNVSGSLIAQDIQTVLNDLEPSRGETQNKVDALLINSGASNDKIKEWKKLSRDPDGLPRLLSDPEFISLPDMTVAIFGKELTGADKANVDRMIDDLALTNLTDEQKTAWDYAKKTGVGASWILAILLAIPAGVAYGMVTTGLSSAGGRR